MISHTGSLRSSHLENLSGPKCCETTDQGEIIIHEGSLCSGMTNVSLSYEVDYYYYYHYYLLPAVKMLPSIGIVTHAEYIYQHVYRRECYINLQPVTDEACSAMPKIIMHVFIPYNSQVIHVKNNFAGVYFRCLQS